MQIRDGRIEENAAQMEELVRDYYARTIARNGMRPLKFNWNAYRALEQIDTCKLFTARGEDDRLIGFVLYIVQDHMHHEHQRIAQCTLLGVRPEYRREGIGRSLIEYAERRFRQDGVTHIVHHHRTIYKVVPLFERMGFKLEELGYVKEL